jgi:uncharacterized protein YecT (DUF1311 family)
MNKYQFFLLSIALISFPASAQEGSAIRKECSGKGSHVEMRACLKTKADESANELRKAEDEMRKTLAKWDQEPGYIRRSTTEFEASVQQFGHYRTHQCEFVASLAAGGNSQGDLRLSCIDELNEKRIAQIRQDESFVSGK